MKRLPFIACFLFCTLLFLGASISTEVKIAADTPVWEVLNELGESMPNHQVNSNVLDASVEYGKNLVHFGHIKGKNKSQSQHFVCTSCHNVEREDPDLSNPDPQARLEYVHQKGLPFLQGSPLFGAVNRTSFYNGDYEKKYGTLVEKARNNLREAIQLCAIECSQGRPLNELEMESTLMYLWELQLTMGDLGLDQGEQASIEESIAAHINESESVALIKSKYTEMMPAHFVDPPADRKAGYEAVKGDSANGQRIYEAACLHCHENQRYSFFNLDDSKFSFKHLNKHFHKYTRYSTYQVVRYGTKPIPGKRAYMPNYTIDKMTHQQVEDLKAYVKSRAQ